MKRFILALIFFVIGCTDQGGRTLDAGQDLESYQGCTWTVISSHCNGDYANWTELATECDDPELDGMTARTDRATTMDGGDVMRYGLIALCIAACGACGQTDDGDGKDAGTDGPCEGWGVLDERCVDGVHTWLEVLPDCSEDRGDVYCYYGCDDGGVRCIEDGM